ncbi:Mss4-like protein [Talaromyces proteolyticus]|uniref:Mss4-like protein n=1 Tax=Talaromyces proteolyticus TaxID=1131652 RepID=A0AAD4Q193_9EURO|nr:Mss4-like protein [Talaromyces proteolyticus]KAH8698323.1 Mss4-like protein [Talaromyces proteolyticus]
MAQDTVSASIACLCGQVSQQIVLSASHINQLSFCHCDSCRSTSGVLCTSYLALHSPPSFSSPRLKQYAQSAHVSRWFCGICGAHVFAHCREEGQDRYLVATGLLTTAAAFEPETRSVSHWGVRDTQDGGLSRFLSGSATNKVAAATCLLQQHPHITKDAESKSKPSVTASLTVDDANLLHARCHCGGVAFSITRPNDQSRAASSPWSDLLVPFHLASSANSDDVKWWLCAENTKYLAGACACKSCRLASGFPIQTWTFVSKINLINNATAEMDGEGFSYETGTLQRYQSSPEIYREFCRICGATVFWHCDWRPGVVDVSVGMLRARSGARAEDWLEWVTGRVSFAEDALDKPLIALLEKGLRESV